MKAVPLDWWWWANVYDCFSRAAVPLFVMLSGALLLTSPSFETGRFFKRRAAKLLPPMLGWTLIYAAWRAWLGHGQITVAALAHNLLDGLDTPAYPHLWFLWIIASLYLLTPLLQPFVMRASTGTQMYMAALWFIVTAVLPSLERWTGWHVGLLIQLPAFGYVGYYVVGACMHRSLPWRLSAQQIMASGLTFVLSVGTTAWLTHVLSVAKGSTDESMMEPLAATVVLMSLSAFVLLRHLGSCWLQDEGAQAARWRERMAWASALSFGVYLSHPLMLDLLDLLAGLPLDPLPHNPLWYAPLVAMLAFVMAGIATALLRAIPGLQRLVP